MRKGSSTRQYSRRFGRDRLLGIHDSALTILRANLSDVAPSPRWDSAAQRAARFIERAGQRGELNSHLLMVVLERLCAAAVRDDSSDPGWLSIETVVRDCVNNPDIWIATAGVLGSEDAWRHILDLLGRGRPHVPTETIQEILGDLFLDGTLLRYRGEAPLGRWLAAIRPHRRPVTRELRVEFLDTFPEGGSATPAERRAAAWPEHVHQALARLPPLDAYLLRLRFWEGCSYARIAERADVGHRETARRRVRTALGRLARVLY